MLSFLIVPCIFGQTQENENYDRVLNTLTERFSPGNSGSNSIFLEERSLLPDYGAFGSSLLLRSQSSTVSGQERGTLVFAVPLNAEFAVDTALSFTEKLIAQETSINIIVAFLGSEKSELAEGRLADSTASQIAGSISHSGLRDLLTLVDMPENWVLCYFDAEEAPSELVLRHGRRGYVAPLDIIKPLPSLLASYDIPWSMTIRHNSIYKLGLVEGPETLLIAWEEEVNGFLISGIPGQEETISPDKLSMLLFEYAGFLNFPVMNTDRHYSLLRLPQGKFFFMTEGFTVTLLIFVAALFLFLYLLYSAGYNAILVYHFRVFIKHSWVLFLFLPWLVISLRISGFLYSQLLRVIYASGAGANFLGVGLAFLFGLLIFALPSPLLDLVHFPRRARFYGFSAVIYGILGCLSAAFLDFSYVTIFLWALIFIFLGAVFSKPILVFISAFFVPLLSISALLNILETGSGRLAELFVFSKWDSKESWTAFIQIALLSLPIVLLLTRGILLFQKSKKNRQGKKPLSRYKWIFLTALILVLTMLVHLFVLKNNYPLEPAYIVEISETENGIDDIVSLVVDDIVFQDSRIITLQLGARGSPIRFDVSLESGLEKTLLPLYSSTVPFEREGDGKKLSFYLGEYPPNPLVMEMVLPLGFEGLLKTQVIYNNWDPAVLPGEKPGLPAGPSNESLTLGEVSRADNDYLLLVTKTKALQATTGIPQ